MQFLSIEGLFTTIIFFFFVVCLFIIPILVIIPFRYFKILFNPNLLKIKKVIPEVLTSNSDYYNKLSLDEKHRFEKRVFRFLLEKKFIGIHEANVTTEMKILIASVANQITFGFNITYCYDSFHKIIISPKDYQSGITHLMHKGETNPAASYVALSWESFIGGIKDTSDCINVGLHEFAHALFSNNVAGELNRSFDENIREWHYTVVELARENETHEFFRRYAFANKMEFFAVSMEYFFEAPHAFNSHIPELYNLMTRILMQDPLQYNNNINRSYSLY